MHTSLRWTISAILVSAASRVKRLESSHCDIFFSIPQIKNNEISTPSTGTRVAGQLFFRERHLIVAAEVL